MKIEFTLRDPPPPGLRFDATYRLEPVLEQGRYPKFGMSRPGRSSRMLTPTRSKRFRITRRPRNGQA
jgi:hypothetical protein